MDYKGFKKAITKSFLKNLIVSVGILLFGVFIAWLILSGADAELEEMTVGGLIVIWTLAGLCLFIGGFMMLKVVTDAVKLNKGDHPILNAISSGDQKFIVWIYQHITTVEGGGSDYQIWAFSLDGSKVILSLKKKRVQDVLDYLSSQFPEAIIGYTEEIEKQMQQTFKRNRS